MNNCKALNSTAKIFETESCLVTERSFSNETHPSKSPPPLDRVYGKANGFSDMWFFFFFIIIIAYGTFCDLSGEGHFCWVLVLPLHWNIRLLFQHRVCERVEGKSTYSFLRVRFCFPFLRTRIQKHEKNAKITEPSIKALLRVFKVIYRKRGAIERKDHCPLCCYNINISLRKAKVVVSVSAWAAKCPVRCQKNRFFLVPV